MFRPLLRPWHSQSTSQSGTKAYLGLKCCAIPPPCFYHAAGRWNKRTTEVQWTGCVIGANVHEQSSTALKILESNMVALYMKIKKWKKNVPAAVFVQFSSNYLSQMPPDLRSEVLLLHFHSSASPFFSWSTFTCMKYGSWDPHLVFPTHLLFKTHTHTDTHLH